MNAIKQELIRTGRWIMEKNLTWGTSGNLSVRSGDRIYITASGTVIGDLKEADILVCDMDGVLLEGDKKPSKETGMHLAVYRARPEIGAVIHTSPFYATMCACCDFPLRTNLFIESMYYDAGIGRIAYYHAGSPQLAEAVGEACRESHVILMEHHGILVYDTSASECRSALEVTENVCKMNLFAQMGNLPLEEVAPDTVREFLDGGYFKKKRD